jgi:NADH:ubiquinone oxidoreductase subunit 4 (subunit M)
MQLRKLYHEPKEILDCNRDSHHWFFVFYVDYVKNSNRRSKCILDFYSCFLLLFSWGFAENQQIPLYTWLPDANGRTGFGITCNDGNCRYSYDYEIELFDLAQTFIIAIVGAVTSLVAATIALVQTDIKKVHLLSTVPNWD